MRSFYTAVLLFVASFVLPEIAAAQPHAFGCHHFRNLGPKRKPLTDVQKDLINESIARSDTFDVIHYNISIDVTDYSGAYIKAATTVSFSPKMTGQEYIRFDLLDLQVDSVKDDSGLLATEYDGAVLKVILPSVPDLGDTLDVTVYYQGSPYQDPVWGGFYFEGQYIYNLGIGLTTIPPNFGKVWYPCFDSFVERATYEYHVKSAGTYRAHCQGDFIGEQQLLGDTVIRSFVLDKPIPTHISAIAVANYEEYAYTHTGQYGDVPVTLRAKSANMPGMQNVFADLGEAIDALEFWYGPHEWSRVGYALTTDGALEIPTNIAYPQFMTGQSIADNISLYSHELGHHWWGDVVTPHNHNDMWMKEGPAEYSSHLVVEWMDGADAFVEIVKDNQLYVLENAHVDDNGFHPMSPMPDEHIYGRHTYYKGASVLHNLRGYLGDELFRQAMSEVQESSAFTDLTPEQLRIALEDASGYDLQPFFDAQIYSPGFATFVVDSFAAALSGNNWNVSVHIQQKLRECPLFYEQVPMDLTVINAAGEREDFSIIGDGEFTTVNIVSSIEPEMIVLNGHNRLNQNRMDYEMTIIPGEGFLSTLPYVDFKLYDDSITDTTLVRVEHIWSGPDDENLGIGIFQIGSRHFWSVDGLWPEGTQLSARLNYRAVETYDLDYDLFATTEADAVLLYRATSAVPWTVYPDFTLNAGNLSSGTGNIEVDVLLQGQYAFANGDPSVNQQELVESGFELNLFPVPASEKLTVKGNFAGSNEQVLLFDIYDISGKLVLRSSAAISGTFEKNIQLPGFSSGLYILKIRNLDGEIIAGKEFSVVQP